MPVARFVGINVVVDDLRRAADAARDAAATAGGVDLPEALSGIAPGMAGSAAAGAADRLAQVWRTKLDDWVRDTGAYADGLAASADAYAATDDDEANRFRGN
ncbi:hypothetical protein [Actinokineospora sp. HUAS TT18]|uniref:hypothetical protein n=1 Tax=Actinokineospora sp. HUAS TT18 TaxID=3447451 RepID=UPI003F51F530